MPLLLFSQCVGNPTKIDIEKGAAERTLTITVIASPAGATADLACSVEGGAEFESPVLGSTLPLQRITIPPNGEFTQSVTLKKKAGDMGVFATVNVQLTEVPASPGALVAPPQKNSAVITIRT